MFQGRAEAVRVLRCSYIPGVGMPTVLIAAGNIDETLIGELYLFVDDQESSLVSQCIIMDEGKFSSRESELLIPFDTQFILELTTRLAGERINQLADKASASDVGTIPRLPCTLDKANIGDLLQTYLMGSYGPKLRPLIDKTHFSDIGAIFQRITRLASARIIEIDKRNA